MIHENNKTAKVKMACHPCYRELLNTIFKLEFGTILVYKSSELTYNITTIGDKDLSTATSWSKGMGTLSKKQNELITMLHNECATGESVLIKVLHSKPDTFKKVSVTYGTTDKSELTA